MRKSNHAFIFALLVWALVIGAYTPQAAIGLDEESRPAETEVVMPTEEKIEEDDALDDKLTESEADDSEADATESVDEANGSQSSADEAEATTPQVVDALDDETVEDTIEDSEKPEETVSTVEEAVETVDPSETDDSDEKEDANEKKDADEQVALTAMSSAKEADAFAAKHAGTIADGTYAITSSLGTGFSLDVRGASKANGAQAISMKTRVAYNQRWVIRNVGGGYVTIKNVNSGKYLQAGYNGKAYYVAQNARSSSNRGQLWIVCEESGYYKFVSAADLKRVLVVSGGVGAKSGYACYSYLEAQSVAANRRWTVSVTSDIQDAQASAHKGDLKDGIYYLSCSGNSKLALSVKGSSCDNRALIVLLSNAAKTSQGWKVTHDSAGYVTFINVRSGKVLDVRGASAKPGVSIIQWTNKKNARNQKWIVAKNPDGTYTIASALTGTQLVLGVGSASSSADTKLFTIEDASTQRWSITNAPDHFAHINDVPDGTFLIQTQLNTKKVLDVAKASKKSGALVKLYNSKSSANQLWTISHDVYGFVHLKSMNSGMQLAYANGKLIQSSASYNWVFIKTSSGQYRIRSGSTEKYLDVRRSNTSNTTNQVILYKRGTGKNQLWSIASPVMTTNTPIMGVSQVTQAQAVKYIESTYSSRGWNLPKTWRNDGETVEKIVSYFWEEGADEGVRGDVALAQSIHETGMFQFGGNVVPEQYNFAGIGVVGGGVKGNYFKNARIGVRAQIQHLKAYASTKPLKKACVDPRFNLVDRGCSPTIAGLSNTWAADDGYATSITNLLNAML